MELDHLVLKGLIPGSLGLVWGSFLNVVAERVPNRRSLVRPGSRCTTCARPIRWRDNVPILSFLLLRGRCRDCGEPIRLRYPLVEAAGGAIGIAAAAYGDPVLAVTTLLFLSALLVLLVTDWERFTLPDAITLPGAGLGLFLAGPRPDLAVLDALLAAALGSGILLLLRVAFLRLRGVEAVGLGDLKMLLTIGAFLTPPATLAVLALASGLGIAIFLPRLLLKRMGRDTPIPFGSLLAVAAAAVFLVR